MSPLANIEDKEFTYNWLVRCIFRFAYANGLVNRFLYPVQQLTKHKRAFGRTVAKSYYAFNRNPSLPRLIKVLREHSNWCYVVRLSDPPKWRLRDKLLLEIATDDASSMGALSFDPTRIDRIDPNFPRTQLLRQHAGHRVDRAFRRGVDDRIRRIEIGYFGADVDDAATLVAKELRRLL